MFGLDIGWPQFFLLAWVFFFLVIRAYLDGKDRMPYDFSDSVIRVLGLLFVLFWGGFFS